MSDSSDYDWWDREEKETSFRQERKTDWTTKDGRDIRICDMTDTHLFNAYNISRDELLFEEMVFRLFEQRISAAAIRARGEMK
jgi:hypothetical protein